MPIWYNFPNYGAGTPGSAVLGSPLDQLQQARAQQAAAATVSPNTSGLATALNAASGYLGGRQEAGVLAANPSLATNQPSPSLLAQLLSGASPSDGSDPNGAGGQAIGRKSDRRLKSDVVRIGTLPNGLPVYRYRLEGGPLEIGCMADEVVRVRPDAVWMADDGFLRVDYSRVL